MLQQSLQDFIIDKLEDLKGKDIITLDVKGKSSITDYMIICTGTSNRHVTSLANNLIDEAKKAGHLVLGSEGQADADWVVVDMDTVIVHIMQQESRALYELEKLWSN
ncbi:ribosome silencing factor [Orbaceae bacterium ac157xtp]